MLAHELDPIVGRDNVAARQLLTRFALGAQPVAVHRNFHRKELRDERAEVVEEAEEAADAPHLRLLVARDPLGGALNRDEVAILVQLLKVSDLLKDGSVCSIVTKTLTRGEKAELMKSYPHPHPKTK